MLLSKNVKGLVCIFLFVCVSSSFAQNEFATIRKNFNTLAKQLHHDLNESKDTLVLKSDKNIYNIYTVGDNSGAIDIRMRQKEFKVPLNHLKKGKYVFVVDQLYLKIVFEVNVLKDGMLSEPVALVTEEISKETISPIEERSLKEVTEKEELDAVVSKSYNLTNVEREGMQSREDYRRSMALARAKKRLKAKQGKDKL